MNRAKLKEVIKNSGITQTALAEKMQISRQTLINKLEGLSNFDIDEINKLRNILRLTDRESLDIFMS